MPAKVNRKIYLVRHGQTDWNVIERLQGTEDIPLNARGEEQALALAIAFRGCDIGRILSSGLKRAKRTAEIVARELAIDEVDVIEALHERDWGRISGMTPQERKVHFPEGIERAEVEPYGQLQGRMINAFEYIQSTFREPNMVILSHGAAINSLIDHFSNGEFGTSKTRLVNCSITRLVSDGSGWKPLGINFSPEEFLTARKGVPCE
jgi:uncharacterized phosphatase